MTPSGDKKQDAPLLYLHLDTGGGFVAAGLYKQDAASLGPVRDKILADADRFANVLSDIEEAGLALSSEHTLTAMPRGYADYSEHRHAHTLKLTSLIVQRDLPKSAWTSGDVMDRAEEFARSAMPLLSFLNGARP